MQCRIKAIISGSVLACIEGYFQGTGDGGWGSLVDCSNSGTASRQCASVLSSNPAIEIKQYGNGFKFALLKRERGGYAGKSSSTSQSAVAKPLESHCSFPAKNLWSWLKTFLQTLWRMQRPKRLLSKWLTSGDRSTEALSKGQHE